MISQMLSHTLETNALLTAFAFVGLVMWFSAAVSKYLTMGRIHASAIAIIIGLGLAFLGGKLTGGKSGLADISVLSGIGLLGGGVLRDFSLVATSFEVDVEKAKKAGLIGAFALCLGTVLPFIVGVLVAHAFGYTDAVSL